MDFPRITPSESSDLLFSFPKAVWDRKTEEERRAFFAKGNIHVFGGLPQDVGGISGWDEKSLKRVVDLYQDREVEG